MGSTGMALGVHFVGPKPTIMMPIACIIQRCSRATPRAPQSVSISRSESKANRSAYQEYLCGGGGGRFCTRRPQIVFVDLFLSFFLSPFPIRDSVRAYVPPTGTSMIRLGRKNRGEERAAGASRLVPLARTGTTKRTAPEPPTMQCAN